MTRRFDHPQAAIAALEESLQVVLSAAVGVDDAAGRVLAADLLADRASPPLDVSAMDGYAMRLADARDALESGSPVLVAQTISAGSPPSPVPAGQAIKIFTGAPVPTDVDCVVKREDVDESQVSSTPSSILLSQLPSVGQNVRRKGENGCAGDVVLPAGTLLSGTRVAGLATFAAGQLQVRRKVRIVVLNTGDELVDPGQPAEAWQIRDSNGPFLVDWLGQFPWLKVIDRRSVADDFETLKSEIAGAAALADAVLLTGGVSMGDADYVPEAIESCGGNIVFHRLPIRPGKPVLGAALDGKLLLGLPGNPASVAVTALAIGMPLLRILGGVKTPPAGFAELANPDGKTLGLVWHRLVRFGEDGRVELVAGKGSGDVVALAHSDGFVVVPPGKSGKGPWPLLTW